MHLKRIPLEVHSSLSVVVQVDNDAQTEDDVSSSAEYGADVASEEDDEATLEEEEVCSSFAAHSTQ